MAKTAILAGTEASFICTNVMVEMESKMAKNITDDRVPDILASGLDRGRVCLVEVEMHFAHGGDYAFPIDAHYSYMPKCRM